MSVRFPGDRAINHGGIGWVEPASGDVALLREISAAADLVHESSKLAVLPVDVVTPGVPRWPWEHHDLGEWTAATVAPHRAAGCELTARCKLAPPR